MSNLEANCFLEVIRKTAISLWAAVIPHPRKIQISVKNIVPFCDQTPRKHPI